MKRYKHYSVYKSIPAGEKAIIPVVTWKEPVKARIVEIIYRLSVWAPAAMGFYLRVNEVRVAPASGWFSVSGYPVRVPLAIDINPGDRVDIEAINNHSTDTMLIDAVVVIEYEEGEQ